MTTTLVQSPIFRQAQKVMFIGGEGIVQSCKHEAGRWTYLVKMPLGVDPNFGRIGAETMVLLQESDLYAT
ncbi:hypothetical protein AB3R30_04860 [Leptolyngbyaceae cyanobacterium UHCC 1019]